MEHKKDAQLVSKEVENFVVEFDNSALYTNEVAIVNGENLRHVLPEFANELKSKVGALAECLPRNYSPREVGMILAKQPYKGAKLAVMAIMLGMQQTHVNDSTLDLTVKAIDEYSGNADHWKVSEICNLAREDGSKTANISKFEVELVTLFLFGSLCYYVAYKERCRMRLIIFKILIRLRSDF